MTRNKKQAKVFEYTDSKAFLYVLNTFVYILIFLREIQYTGLMKKRLGIYIHISQFQHCTVSISDHPNRKTKYDLIAVEKGSLLINMDSQAPNEAALEAIPRLFPDALQAKREFTHGDSRFDLHLVLPRGEMFIEVKGVTLEREGHLYFPDAPTQRGSKHLRGLMQCVQEGYRAMVLFVAQMKGVHAFSPNDATDPVFADTLRAAAKNGVEVKCVDCIVQPDSMVIDREVPVIL